MLYIKRHLFLLLVVLFAFSQANASCGDDYQKAFNSINQLTRLCSNGESSRVTEKRLGGSDVIFQWGCANEYCFAYKKVDGICGKAVGGLYTTPPKSNLCVSGVSTPVITNNGGYSWQCLGLNGGSNNSCSASVGAQCGEFDKALLLSSEWGGGCFILEKSNEDVIAFVCSRDKFNSYCNGGVPIMTRTDFAAYTASKGVIVKWHCVDDGTRKASTACSAVRRERGLCNDGQIENVTDVCRYGTAKYLLSSGGFHYWKCEGGIGFQVCKNNMPKNGNNPKLIDGVCGSINYTTLKTLPSDDYSFCKAGVKSPSFDNSVAWAWNCNGINGGETVPCYVHKSDAGPIDGECGGANGGTYPSAPKMGLCVPGVPSVPKQSNNSWVWSCGGVNGGKTVSCSAVKGGSKCSNVSNPVCGADNKTYLNKCHAEEAGVKVLYNGECRVLIYGKCGNAINKQWAVTPDSELCESGAASKVKFLGSDANLKYNWQWSCAGSGSTTDCIASMPKSVTGVACGSDNGKKLSSFPSSNTCVNGRLDGYGSYGKSGPWIWFCTDDKGKRVVCRSV